MAADQPVQGIHNAPTIQIQEPTGKSASREDSRGREGAHGIYSMRIHSANSFPIERARSRSFSRTSTTRRTAVDWDTESGLQQEGDFKEKQVMLASSVHVAHYSSRCSGLPWQNAPLVWCSKDSIDSTSNGRRLAYQSVGIIYGDIGTSPLYVYSSTFSSAPSYDDLLGVLSIVIWSLTMMVTLKYVLIILRADNEGEGGTFSTYSLLSRYVGLPVK